MSGLLLDGLDLDNPAGGYQFEVIEGNPDDPPEYVGEDDLVPGAAGMEHGLWTPMIRTVKLRGDLWGDGANVAARRVSYRARADALRAKMAPDTLVAIVAGDDHFGLSPGETATLSNCRPVSITGMSVWLYEIRRVVLELVCIDSPPEWDIAEESP